MHATVVEPLVGNLFDSACREVDSLRALAMATENHSMRAARLRLVAIIEELIVYARARDDALARLTRECALLRAKLGE